MRVFISNVQFVKKISRLETSNIDDFGPFQESMVEISAKKEKELFLRSRFFRKIEEISYSEM